MRLIDADALEPKFVHGRWDDTYVSNSELINAPTIDAVEHRYGKWIKMSDADGIYFACSICGENLPRIQHFDPQFDLFPRLESIDKTNFCPNCGADMKTKETDRDYERSVEQLEHDILYEPTFNQDDGSM